MLRLTLGLAIAVVVAVAVPCADALFPGRNGLIVFVSNRASGPRADRDPDLYTMDANGRRLKALTANLAFERSPRWSPRGKRIAFARYDKVYAIHVMRADASGVKRIS